MISRKYKCIFIHIPKTAGTSIEKKLGHFESLKRGVQDHRTIREIESVSIFDFFYLMLRRQNQMAFKHLKNIARGRLPVSKKEYNNYFKFTFVRNPWSRVFSWYKNVQRDEHHRKRYGVAADCKFNEFINDHLNQYEVNPQLYWIKNRNGQIPLDFIGRFENLENDFYHVANIIGIEDKKLPKLVSGNGERYTHYYDDRLKDIVFKKYHEEIKLFNFEYGE